MAVVRPVRRLFHRSGAIDEKAAATLEQIATPAPRLTDAAAGLPVPWRQLPLVWLARVHPGAVDPVERHFLAAGQSHATRLP